MSSNRLGLGTVQFGIPYGVANQTGQCTAEEAARILTCAQKAGMLTLDTGPGYGTSEEVLGSLLSPDPSWRIVTKTSHSTGESLATSHADNMKLTFRRSLSRLKREQVYGLLFHRSCDLFGPEGRELMTAAKQLKDEGLVQKLGVSVYEPEELEKLFDLSAWDIVQVPASVLDQRMVRSGMLRELKARRIEVHARSILLQGLLTLSPDSIMSPFKPLEERIRTFQEEAMAGGMTPAQGALAYVLGIPEIDTVLLGVDSESQLREYLEVSAAQDMSHFEDYAVHESDLINPANWPALKRGELTS